MRDGDHARARAVNDAVLAARRQSGAVADDPALPYHARFVWTGRPVDGSRVLVRCYHGLGDTLMMARFLAPLAARAASVTLEAPAALAPLLGRAEPSLRVVPFDHHHPLPPDEVDVEIAELGHALGLGPEDAPPRPPALDAVALADRTVGVCWRAGEWLEARSVPLAALAPPLRASGRPLLALQHGPARQDAMSHPGLFGGPGADGDPLERTAALVAGCALVVTVDTMVAHLALLLGRPTIVLLRHEADWRWGRPGAESPWYPRATLLRQRREGDWSAPVADLAACLRAAG